MTTYMLILLATHEMMHAERSPEEVRRSGEAWRAWHEELEAAGRLRGGLQLAPPRCRVSTDGIEVVEVTPSDELVVGGYFLVEAESLAEASEIAMGCPLVAAGGQVEVRPSLDV